MGIEYLTIALILFMLISALIAVETRDLLSSVIALGAAGFALSVLDLLLGAPDLGITQVVVEVIALVLLVRVVLTRQDTSVTQPRDALRTAAVLLSGGVILAIVFFAVGGNSQLEGTMAKFGEPAYTRQIDVPGVDGKPKPVSADYLSRAAAETGAANSVAAVLLDYRAYDTLGEATVIFVSVLGAYVILRKVGRKKEELVP